MVVDDSHLAAFFQYLAALHQTQLVCIHDDTERSLGNDGQSALGVDEVVLLPCRDEGVDEAARQGGVTAHGDDCRHIADLADAQHALGRADGVQVAHPVTHDDHMVSLFDELDQLVGHDAAAHLAALFHAVADTAVEGKAVRGHLGGLVAAAPLRHIQRLNGHVLSLPQGLGPASDADGDGEVHAGVEGADLVQHVVRLDGERRRVDARMAADHARLRDGLVDDELNMVLRIVHQPQHADRAGRDVEIALHICRIRERQPRHAKLLGKVFRLEVLLPFQHQQVKLRLLPVAEEEILADLLAEHGLDGLACLDRVRKVVVDARIRNAQPIKQVIAALLLREALFKVFRSSFKYRFANVHFHHPARIARSTTVASF